VIILALPISHLILYFMQEPNTSKLIFTLSSIKFVCNNELVVQFISSKDQLAYALTKPLLPVKFRQLQLNLNVRDLPSRLRGRVENQVMVTEIKDEDQELDQPVNATTKVPRDHNKQS